MTISDALPVQFWSVYDNTYNESEICGIHNACWCQPWNCSDPILIQLTDTPGLTYTLRIVDESDDIVDTLSMTEALVPGVDTTSYYQVSFVPSNLDVCNQYVKLQIRRGADVVAKSDCLDVRTSHQCTYLIEYSNSRNYAGLIYGANESPDVIFSIRVPSRFFHERYPEEDDAIELTSSVVITSSQVKTQRLLEVQHSPYYFHKKVKLVLKHQNLNIDNLTWQKEESYDIIEGNKRWPLKPATCYLTETTSVERNVI
jgi:hypothetical protein